MHEYTFRISHRDSAVPEKITVAGTLDTARIVYDELKLSGYTMLDERP